MMIEYEKKKSSIEELSLDTNAKIITHSENPKVWDTQE